MKKLALIFSFLFILIGCGGGGGSSNKFVAINQANLNDILATYYSSLDSSYSIIYYYFNLAPYKYNTNDGSYRCSDGGTYSVATKGNQKVFEYNSCRTSNMRIRTPITLNGTVKMSNSGLHKEFIDLLLTKKYSTKFNGTVDYKKSNNIEYYKLNIKIMYNNKAGVELQGGVYEYKYDYNNYTTTQSINTTATSSKLNGNIKIETISQINKKYKCPTSGEVKISGDKDYLNIKYRSSMNIDVYLNGDNSVITSFNDCGDFPKY